MATISLRLNNQEDQLFRNYANLTGKTLSELLKTALIEQIEDQFDYELGAKALEEFENDPNPVTYSIEEAAAELGITL
ncbi:TPA: translation repressor RelB [Streptococcus suis 8830]|uniref:type II toxin-antitoxin system RelB family antitoxin n=1 Tax=Streptococcus suis TaxID=1307 RepID=UPI0003F8C074|nr:DUF6290 family protein [Streptococcus suis]HEM3204023.1 translation repressor RelB [Streptococcus suis 8830]